MPVRTVPGTEPGTPYLVPVGTYAVPNEMWLLFLEEYKLDIL